MAPQLKADQLLDKIRGQINSGLQNQRAAAALLIAVEDTIKSSGLQISATAYFANLMTLLTENGYSDGDPEDIATITYLLSVIMSGVPTIVLRQKYKDINAAFMECMQAFGDNAAIVKNLMECAAHVIICQETAAWSTAETNNFFQLLTTRLVDERPKVRKTALQAIRHILSRPPPPMVHHPASSSLSRLLLQIMRDGDDTQVLHLLGSIKDLIQFVEKKHLESLALHFIKLTSNASKRPMIASQSLECLARYFESAAGSAIGDERYSYESLEKLVDSLLAANRPSVNDEKMMPQWLLAVVGGALALKQLNGDAFLTYMPQIFKHVFSLLQQTPGTRSQIESLHAALFLSMESLISRCLSDDLLTTDRGMEVMVQLVKELGTGLSLSYQSGWAVVLKTIKIMFSRLETLPALKALELMHPILSTLADDEVYGQNEHYAHRREFLAAMEAAMRCLGPRYFLSVLPLNLDTDAEPKRTWLLPLLKDNIRNTDLEYFLTALLPTSQQIALRGQQYLQNNQPVEGKMCAVVWKQLWDTLPGFCHAPVDLQQMFEPLCKIIVPMLASNDERVPSICEALRLLVLKNQSIASAAGDRETLSQRYRYGPEQAKEIVTYLSGYSQHLLPPLFAKYVELCVNYNAPVDTKSANLSPAQIRPKILETIKIWIAIAAQPVIDQFFETTMRKYLQQQSSESNSAKMEQDGGEALADSLHEQYALLDLTIAILSTNRLSMEAVALLHRIVLRGIAAVGDGTLQKKCYRILCLTFENSTTESQADSEKAQQLRSQFWSNPQFIKDLARRLLDATAVTEINAKHNRMQLLSYLVSCLPWQPIDGDFQPLSIIPSILSEVIIGTKEVGEKARLAAYELLLAMGRRMREAERESEGMARVGNIEVADGEDDDEEDQVVAADAVFRASLDEFMKMVVAGLAGKTPHMISATINSLARLLYEFKDEGMISQDILEAIIQSVLVYAEECRNREIIKSIVSFLKVIVVVFPQMLHAPTAPAKGGMMNTEETERPDEEFNYCESIMTACLKWSAEHKSHFRTPCRYVIDRIVRKVGLEAVEKYFPEDQHKLLTNIRKRRDRSLRAKDPQQQLQKQQQQKSFSDFLKDGEGNGSDAGSDEDSDDEDEQLPQLLREMVDIRQQGGRRGDSKKQSSHLSIREDLAEDTADLLDHKAVRSLVKNPLRPKQKAGNKSSTASSTFNNADDGRMIIKDSDEETEKKLSSKKAALVSEAESNYLELMRSKDSFQYSADGKKVKFNQQTKKRDRDDGGEMEEAPELESGGSRKISQPRNQLNKRQRADMAREKAGIAHGGKEYRGKKAKGDVKKKGKPDPYAYIPLNSKIVSSNKGKKRGLQTSKHVFDI